MVVVANPIDVNVRLPRETYEEVCQAASKEKRSVDDELAMLVESGLKAERSYQELFDELAKEYRARMHREGKSDQTKEEVLAELRALRQKVADEFYTV